MGFQNGAVGGINRVLLPGNVWFFDEIKSDRNNEVTVRLGVTVLEGRRQKFRFRILLKKTTELIFLFSKQRSQLSPAF